MNYEQKYKQALERATKMYNSAKELGFDADVENLQMLFPELAESEDERIRKAIYNALKYLETEHSWDFLDVYAWLEKQGDMKENNNYNPKFGGTMSKIKGKHEQLQTEDLLKEIVSEDSIAKRHHLIAKYLYQREKQVEKILANIENDDIDLVMVIEQLWEDLHLAHEQLVRTMARVDFVAKL